MSVSLTQNFLANARGITFKNGGGITWTFNQATNELTATGAGGSGIGTVTSVGLSDGSTAPIFNISGSPVVAAGTLTFTFKTQTAATFLAGPGTGAAAQPTFRAIVSTDVPVLNQNTSGNAATATTAAACSGNAATATTAAACSGNAATATSAATAATLSATLVVGKGGTGVTGASLGSAAGVALGDTGTFVPTVAGSSTAGVGTYVTQQGNYTRIGNRCFFDLRVRWSATTGTGNLVIGGLPFAANNTAASSIFKVYVNSGITAIPMVINLPGTTNIEFDKFTVGTGVQVLAIPAAADVFISGSYTL